MLLELVSPALEPVLLEPVLLEPVLLEPEADGLAEELPLFALAPFAFVTEPETATSWPICWFSFEVSAPEGMIR